jgi:hypothetical protein
MATRRKTTTRRKKSEEQVEQPQVESPEVIEPVAEESAPEPQPEVVDPVPPLAPEPPLQKKAEPEPPQPVEEVSSAPAAVITEPVVDQVVASSPRVVEIGSLVMMPTGKRGTVIAVNRKGYFEVRSERNPRKTYLYKPSQLSLV